VKITAFGASSDKIDIKYRKSAEELGAEIAKRGHTLVFGAGACGVMGGLARGAKSQNGEIIGIVPKFFTNENVEELFEDCTQTVYTDTMNERKQLMENLADAYIIAPGGIGTFDEFFEILTNKQLRIENKPIAIYNYMHYYDPLEELIEHAIKYDFVRETCRTLYKITDNIDELFDYIENGGKVDLTVKELKDG